MIAKLDPKEFEYNLHQKEARYQFTKSQLSRSKTLYKKGFVSGTDYDRKTSDFQIAEANLRQAKKDMADTKLLAPYDGTVVRKYIKEFQQIKVNEPIVSYQDINFIDVKINIPENVIANIKKSKDKPVSVVFEAVPNRSFDLKVKEFSAEADPETQTYSAVFTMPAPKNVNILPGMTATVKLDLPAKKIKNNKVLLIPSSAVFINPEKNNTVWLVTPKTNKIKMTTVTIGELRGNKIQILNGLKPGEIIVTGGVHFLQNNEKIRPEQVKGPR